MGISIKTIPWQRNRLWQGCLLAAIAHAIMVSRYSDMANEHSWDGINYSVQDSSGARGTVTFHEEYCVAAFREENRGRLLAKNKKLEGRLNFKVAAETYFAGAPKAALELARAETLQYLRDEIDGQVCSCITTSCWGTEDKVYSIDSYEDFLACGGFLLATQCQDAEIGIKSWQEEYDMSAKQVGLLRGIFEHKLKNPAEALILSEGELHLLAEVGEELEESRSSFAEIGIYFPDSFGRG